MENFGDDRTSFLFLNIRGWPAVTHGPGWPPRPPRTHPQATTTLTRRWMPLWTSTCLETTVLWHRNLIWEDLKHKGVPSKIPPDLKDTDAWPLTREKGGGCTDWTERLTNWGASYRPWRTRKNSLNMTPFKWRRFTSQSCPICWKVLCSRSAEIWGMDAAHLATMVRGVQLRLWGPASLTQWTPLLISLRRKTMSR